MWDPDSVSPEQINDLRHAAEQAWGDDTRNERFVGHPQPSAGHCYVTSAWMTKQLGGHVGTKDGHYFWVSPDKRYAIDLAGDRHAYAPEDPGVEGTKLDQNDEGAKLDPHQTTWRPGPALYKQTDHPLFKGFRVVGTDGEGPAQQRAELFGRRADAALRGECTSHHYADLMGPSGLSTPQQAEDYDMNAPMPMLHDEPNYDPVADMTTQEYKWVFSNGQLHVSPMHSHEELFDHAGGHPASTGPAAVGYVTVNQGHALWEVSANVSMRGLHEMLTDYSDTVGWKFDGMVGPGGEHIHDDFGPKKSMWYATRKDGHLVMSERPLPHGYRIRIEGKTAYVSTDMVGLHHWTKNPDMPALREWADDFGYKLAEFPGGGDMTDKMKVRPNLDVYNRGDTDFQPERDNPDQDLGDSLTCGGCGQIFTSLAELRLHHRDHEPHEEEIQDGHFPQLDDFDAPLPFRRRQPSPNWGENIARTAIMMLPSHKVAARFPRFDLYAKLFNYQDDENLRFYGAYRCGQLVGYGAIRLNGEAEPEALMIDTLEHRSGIGTAILGLMQTHFDHFYTHADSEGGERLMRRMGMVNVQGHRWRWAKGEEPKDMIEATVPFIYDIEADKIQIGYPGQQTRDIQGQFTPGGIFEGYYEPGGKVILIGTSTMPVSLYHFGQLWYHSFPQMEITNVELENQSGETQKLAAQNVGHYLKTLVASDQAAYNAYQALRDSGGKVYIVGGAIRDALQQREPKDLDLMVAGLPTEQVAHALGNLPGRVDLTGKRFGVYRYKVGGQEVEVALPRQDKYETSRRGEGVITVDHNLPIEKDLERRDFTANSMAVDLDNGRLIDPHGGAADLEHNVLRTTHPDSFREDPTRMVRALAAHGRFGLQPDERTRFEMADHAAMLRSESPDALNKVLDKTFLSHNPAAAIRLAHDTGILRHLFPEVEENWNFDQNNPHHHKVLGEHLLHVLDNVSKSSPDADLRLAALYHDVGKPVSEWRDPVTGSSHYYQGPNGEGANHEVVGAKMLEDRMRALNYPVARIRRATDLVQHHMFPAFNSPRGARRFLNRVDDHADDLLTLRRADMEGKGNGPEYFAGRTSVDKMSELVDQARREQAPTAVQNLAINGNDLIAIGMQAGPAIGNTLRALVDHVIDTPTDNTRDRLLQLAQSYQQAQP